MVLYRAGLRLIWRRKIETIVIVFLLSIAVGMYAMIDLDLYNFVNYIKYSIRDTIGYANFIGLFNNTVVNKIRMMPGVESVKAFYYWSGYTYISIGGNKTRLGVALLQYDERGESISILVTRGRPPANNGEAVLYHHFSVTPPPELELGKNVTVYSVDINGSLKKLCFTIVGEATGPINFGGDVALFIPRNVLKNVTRGRYTWISVYGSVYTDEAVGKLADEVLEYLNKSGIELYSYMVNRPSDNPVKSVFEGVADMIKMLLYTAIAIIAVLSAASSISLIERNTRLIGVLKAVGATKRQVFLLYSIPWLARGAIGLALGLAISPFIAEKMLYLFIPNASIILNFFLTKYGFTVDPYTLAWSGIVCGATILVASLVPGAIASRIRVVEAIRFTGLKPRRTLGFSGSLMLRLSLRNLFSRPWKIVGLVLSIAIMWSGLMALSISINGFWAIYRDFEEHYPPDLSIHVNRLGYTAPTTALDAYKIILNTSGVAYAETYVYYMAMNAFGMGRAVIFVTVINGSWKLSTTPVAEGRYPCRDGEALIGPSIARLLGVGVGSTIRYRDERGREWVLKVVGIGKLNDQDGFYVYIPKTSFAKIFDIPLNRLGVDSVIIRVRVREGVSPMELGWRIKRSIEENPYLKASFRARSETLRMMKDNISMIAMIFAMLYSVSIFVGLAVITSILVVDFTGRLREIGVLRAIGFTNASIALLNTLEALEATIVAIPLAATLGVLQARMMLDRAIKALGCVPFNPSVSDVLNVYTLAILALSYIISFITVTLYLRRQKTSEILRVE